jgi:hypothetical protein
MAVRSVRPGDVATVPVPDPDAITDDLVPVVCMQLAALLARAAARLASLRPRPPDRLLDAEETAKRLCTTEDWLGRQDSKRLPFRVPLSGGQVRYSEQGLEDYIAGLRGT